MRILFRTSGGRIPKKELGLGHIFRCLNLSREFKQHQIHFLIEDYGSVSTLLQEYGFKKIFNLTPGSSINVDIKQTSEYILKNKIDLLIVDKYGLANKYVKTLKKIVRVIVISDLKNIEYDADLIINGFIGYKNKIVQNKYGTKCLLGPKYQILDHRYVNNRFSNEKKFDMLVTFGGFDSSSIIPILLKSLESHIVKLKIKIILGPSTKKTKEITQLIQKHKKHLSVIQKTQNMRKEIGQSKFGFCAGGITTYEFARMRRPFAMICQYEHQLVTAREWQKRQIGLNLGMNNKSIPRKVQSIASNFRKTRACLKTNHNLVDGFGSTRIAKEIHDL